LIFKQYLEAIEFTNPLRRLGALQNPVRPHEPTLCI
jgi:hypothetical protein